MSQSFPSKSQVLVLSFDSDPFPFSFFFFFFFLFLIFLSFSVRVFICKAVQYPKGLDSVKYSTHTPNTYVFTLPSPAHAHTHTGAEFNSPVLPVFKVSWPLLSL